MLAMNLIKVFPAWYHPRLTRSVTHAQMLIAYLIFLLPQQKKIVRRKEQMRLATSDLSLHQERPSPSPSFWLMGSLPSELSGVMFKFFFSFNLFNLRRTHHTLGMFLLGSTSPFCQKNLNCSSLSPSRRCFGCVIDIEPGPSRGNVGNDKVPGLSFAHFLQTAKYPKGFDVVSYCCS